jgi:hypothetical protein
MSIESKLKHQKWEEEQREKTGSLKKPILCKGKKEHQFILVIPKYFRLIKPMTIEEINMFYFLGERYVTFMKGQSEAYERIGLKKYSEPRVIYYYKCSVCGKEKSEYKKI